MTPHPHTVSYSRRVVFVLLAASLFMAVPAISRHSSAASDEVLGETKNRFPEIGRVALFDPPLEPARSGWLILNSVSRRGYQVFEGTPPGRTVIQSFDLDTFKPLRRAQLSGAPIAGGRGNVGAENTTGAAGDIVHAVDPEGGRIYLALSQPSAFDHQARQVPLAPTHPPDAQRPLARFVTIDETKFNSGAVDFAASFREPIGQERLHAYWVVGMKVTRQFVKRNEPGRLLVLFAQPRTGGNFPIPTDHTVAQWEAPGPGAFAVGKENETAPTLVAAAGELRVTQTEAAGPARRLDACMSATLASSLSAAGALGNYQWGMLVTRDAVWTACQAAAESGAVTRIPLDATGHLDPLATHDLYRLSQKISDVFVDDGGERLLVRSYGNGHTWWVFDTRLRRYTGAIAGKAADQFTYAAGIDPTSGRLYQLMQDYSAPQGGREVPVRGGFSFGDSRLNPPPPLENARPDLAYPAGFRIQVDPPTRRVFVRRAHQFLAITPTYPRLSPSTPAPPEHFYRVLSDNVPLSESPPPPDDSAFTTEAPEDPATTRASYLGTGHGYGVRSFLVGGLDAAADRRTTHPSNPCGPDDRELLSGAVRSVEVSDLSTAAEAAGLDGDAKTQEQLAEPAQRCGNSTTVDSDELAFDERDKNGRRDGDNRYRASCTGDGNATERLDATAPKEGKVTVFDPTKPASATSTTTSTVAVGKVVPRDGFEAKTTCEHSHGQATAEAKGKLVVKQLDDRQADAAKQNNQVPKDTLQVGHARSTVTVTRKAGEGVTVKVDSIARDVVIPGVGTIGAVRGEATVTSNGRRGGAKAVYTRTVCDFNLEVGPGFSNCLSGKSLDDRERQINQALGSRGRVRFRNADPTLYAGSRSGYKAGVQRPALDLFEDSKIAKDTSLALPAMEIVFFNGDGDAGPGRQFVQLAGVQAGTSYGIACLYGQRPTGGCSRIDDVDEISDEDVVVAGSDDSDDGNGGSRVETVRVTEQGDVVQLPGRTISKTKPLWRRIVEAPVNVVKDVLRLLFANPREFGLMAAVWALLWGPCYLGERRRNLRNLRARRAALGGVA